MYVSIMQFPYHMFEVHCIVLLPLFSMTYIYILYTHILLTCLQSWVVGTEDINIENN